MKRRSRMRTAYHGGERIARDAVFPGTGEMAERCRTFDWSTTPLGPVSTFTLVLPCAETPTGEHAPR